MTAKPAYLVSDRVGDIFAVVVLGTDLAELTHFETHHTADARRTVAALEAAAPGLVQITWGDVEALAKFAPAFPGVDVRPTRPLVTVRAIATIARNLRASLAHAHIRKKSR